MQPTNKLRWAKRISYSRNGEHFVNPFLDLILQQWWCEFNGEGREFNGYWRDVEVENEE